MSEEITLLDMVNGVSALYADYTDKVRSLGAKGKKRSGKGKDAFAHWIGGGFVTTDRERMSEEFHTELKGKLELILTAFEGASEEETREAADELSRIMLSPKPKNSNATTDLMKRAVQTELHPFLSYMSKEALAEGAETLLKAYGKWQMLPNEKELYKKMKALAGV